MNLLSIANILYNRLIKERRILRYNSKLLPQAFNRNIANILAVNLDVAFFFNIVEPEQQFQSLYEKPTLVKITLPFLAANDCSARDLSILTDNYM
jgi:hypothetical protein